MLKGHKLRGAKEVYERDKRGALMGTKVKTVFFIFTHFGNGTLAPKVQDRWTRGAALNYDRIFYCK